MSYLHKCDECSEVFKDDKEPKEHYADTNGYIFCPKHGIINDSTEDLEKKALKYMTIKDLIEPLKRMTCNTCKKIKRIIDETL